MVIIIGSTNSFLTNRLSNLAAAGSSRVLRSSKVDRIIQELKSRGRVAVVDAEWEDLQAPGVLKRIVNVARISGNKVVVVCPNQDEDLKKLAAQSRAHKIMLRFELQPKLKEYLEAASVEMAQRAAR